jgi:lipid-A-disaccharide synthase
VDHLLTIHAFDAPYFEKAGLATTFVGNPVLAADVSAADPRRFRHEIGAEAEDPILVIAPGSRRGEVKRLLGPFADAVSRLRAGRTRLKVAVLAADAVSEEVTDGVKAWGSPVEVVRGEGRKQSAMAAATAALACSGTVTTELAMLSAPMVVAYRLDPLAHPIAKVLIRTPYITLLNVAAGRFVVPELVQTACTGGRLAAALAPLLDDPIVRRRQIREQADALGIMRGGVTDPSMAAADAVIVGLGAKAQDRVSKGT